MHRISMEKPDILISFAGVISPEAVTGGSISSWHRQIQVNLLGQFNVTHAALQGNARCRVVLIGSSAARKPRATWSAYCAAKAGLVMFVQCLVAEGVDAWCLNIGRTATKMRRGLFPDEDQRTLMTPGQVAQEIVAILSDRRVERVSWVSCN
jgi:NAD(P)-dependent dehydrogenase (short-subunit alcohol dehydrogenase family)